LACTTCNAVGDVCGIWLGGTIDAFAKSLDVRLPRLTSAQEIMHRTQFAKTMGAVLGVLFGCFLGMFPLLWPQYLRLWPEKSHRIHDDEASMMLKILD
jgi:hypothetical protein